MAEDIEISHLKPDRLIPEVGIEMIDTGDISDNQRQNSGENQDIAARGVMAQRLSGSIKDALLLVIAVILG